MGDVELEEFRRKAPLIEPGDFMEMVLEDMLTEETLRRAESLWIVGSFVRPDKEIDAGSSSSDLDLFVCLPDWDHPITGSGLALLAPQTATPKAYGDVDGYGWDSKDTPEWKWECSPQEAWERIPEHAQQTLVRVTRKYFYARPEDVDEDNKRTYEVSVVNRSQLEYGIEDAHALRIWPDREEEEAPEEEGRGVDDEHRDGTHRGDDPASDRLRPGLDGPVRQREHGVRPDHLTVGDHLRKGGFLRRARELVRETQYRNDGQQEPDVESVERGRHRNRQDEQQLDELGPGEHPPDVPAVHHRSGEELEYPGYPTEEPRETRVVGRAGEFEDEPHRRDEIEVVADRTHHPSGEQSPKAGVPE